MNEKEEPFGAEAAREGLRSRFEGAKASYNQILNRLWAGNTAGALAAVGALGSGKIGDTKLLLLALSSFLLGVFALGLGSFASLIAELLDLRDWQSVNSILDLKTRHFRRPSEEAGVGRKVNRMHHFHGARLLRPARLELLKVSIGPYDFRTVVAVELFDTLARIAGDPAKRINRVREHTG